MQAQNDAEATLAGTERDPTRTRRRDRRAAQGVRRYDDRRAEKIIGSALDRNAHRASSMRRSRSRPSGSATNGGSRDLRPPLRRSGPRLAEDVDAMASWSRDLRTIADFVSEPDITGIVRSGKVPRSEKMRLLEAGLEGQISPLALNLVRVLVERNKLRSCARSRRVPGDGR